MTRHVSILCVRSLSRVVVGFNFATVAFAQSEPPSPLPVTINVNASDVLRKIDPRRLGGTNIAAWNSEDHFSSPQIKQWMAELKPGFVRLPGGSWSNIIYWNGNGVRGADGQIDTGKVGADGYPAVDYSDYKSSFVVDSKTLAPVDDKSYHMDVKGMHEFIRAIPGAEPMPCLNAGTGRPIDAAEWVKWANGKMGYDARIWEIGNELDGGWEPGHVLPHDGGTLTGDMYVKRYNAIADAMKAVDPTLKIGGCAFTQDVIRGGGANVDFASIHTYPGSTGMTPQENLAELPATVKREVDRVRGWINEYQPARAKDIQIAYTEWNLAGGLSASDLFSGLWHSVFLAEMARNGVDFATQWDSFTHNRGMKAGHGLFWTDGNTYVRKVSYYALMLWNTYTGDRLLATTSDHPGAVYTLASRTDDAVYLMLMNPSDDRDADVTVNLSGFTPAGIGERVTLTSREYFWNPTTSEPVWSQSPAVERFRTGERSTVHLPPFSMTYLRLPSADKPALTDAANNAPPTPVTTTGPELRFFIPDEIYAGDTVQGYVAAFIQGTERPYPTPLAPAALGASDAATFDRPAARLTESLGRFTVNAAVPGSLTLTATSGDVRQTKIIHVKPTEPRPILFWDFSKPEVGDARSFSSDFSLKADPSMRPNKDVARVDLLGGGVVPSEKGNQRTLLMVKEFPPESRLDRANIRGVFFDMTTRDLSSEDPNASVTIVMQSPANYWMTLGNVPLKNALQWQRYQVDVTQTKYLNAMPSAYNVWFVLNSNKPVKGSIYFDKIGLMVR